MLKNQAVNPSDVFVSFDASWSGTGWAICTSEGPVRSGRKRLPGAESEGQATRARAVQAWLQELEVEVREVVQELQASTGKVSRVRVVIERIPWVYGDRGNQAAIGFGQGRLVGMLEWWGTRNGWASVWLLPSLDEAPDPPRKRKTADVRPTWPPTPADVLEQLRRQSRPTEPIWHGWRPWWGIRGARARAKATAIRLVRANGWGAHLEGLAETPADSPPAGDVAEAILMGVGAARHPGYAPTDRGAA